MRLLNVNTLRLKSFDAGNIPKYAIASHRWVADEATYDDVKKRRNCDRAGYKKVVRFCSFVKPWNPKVEWLWIDTCCIDKKSSAELSESINSMFRWYANAEVCFAYLADVGPLSSGIDAVYKQFKSSVWFTRGWTLEELVAPKSVVFLTQNWEIFGSKGVSVPGVPETLSLDLSIADITGIPPSVLMDYESSRNCSDDDKWTWATNRSTTKEEDLAYCLLGIFGVNMPLVYGEGSQAKVRLREEIRVQKRRLKLKQTKLVKGIEHSTLSVSSLEQRHKTKIKVAKQTVREEDKMIVQKTLAPELALHAPQDSAATPVPQLPQKKPQASPSDHSIVPLHGERQSSDEKYLRKQEHVRLDRASPLYEKPSPDKTPLPEAQKQTLISKISHWPLSLSLQLTRKSLSFLNIWNDDVEMPEIGDLQPKRSLDSLVALHGSNSEVGHTKKSAKAASGGSVERQSLQDAQSLIPEHRRSNPTANNVRRASSPPLPPLIVRTDLKNIAEVELAPALRPASRSSAPILRRTSKYGDLGSSCAPQSNHNRERPSDLWFGRHTSTSASSSRPPAKAKVKVDRDEDNSGVLRASVDAGSMPHRAARELRSGRRLSGSRRSPSRSRRKSNEDEEDDVGYHPGFGYLN